MFRTELKFGFKLVLSLFWISFRFISKPPKLTDTVLSLFWISSASDFKYDIKFCDRYQNYIRVY